MAKRSNPGESVKTETLTIRVTPKIKYGLELLARVQHRSLGGVVEWAIEKGLADERDGLVKKVPNNGSIHLLHSLWHPSEAVRLYNLYYFCQALMTYEEQKLWELIESNAYYWRLLEFKDNEHKKDTVYFWSTKFSALFRSDAVDKDLKILKSISLDPLVEITPPIWIPGNKSAYSEDIYHVSPSKEDLANLSIDKSELGGWIYEFIKICNERKIKTPYTLIFNTSDPSAFEDFNIENLKKLLVEN